ncbi:MAG: hypothetical protein P4M07_07980 [Xanthobacteraceae bacterium]|nr:hypothetical protein [Xanthobacteraceae bacterium]
MSAILKLKSDGAQALLTAALLLGCALNVMLVLAFAGRAVHGFPDTVDMSARSVATAPASTGRPETTPQRSDRAIATAGRPSPARAQRAS